MGQFRLMLYKPLAGFAFTALTDLRFELFPGKNHVANLM